MNWNRTQTGVTSGDFSIERQTRQNQYSNTQTTGWVVRNRGRVVGMTAKLESAKAIACDIAANYAETT